MLTEEEIYNIYEEQEAKKEPQKRSIVESLAKVMSTIFSPLLVPTYGIIIALNFTFVSLLSPLSSRIIVSLAIHFPLKYAML